MKQNYTDLFKRNIPLIGSETQKKVSELRILVAGCGSTGGAFIEGASRLGVINFKLSEPDHFELHNLNRQFVYPENIGQNKAEAHAGRLQKLFEGCDAKIEVNTTGISSGNMDLLLKNVDLVFDAVDVTTPEGITAKFLLHERAAQKKLLVLSGLDLGFKQWLRIYDYRTGMAPLEGKLASGRACRNPLKALVESICPLEDLSYEIAIELLRLLQSPGSSACQLASPCHLLAGFASPLILRFVENKSLPKLISFDPMRSLETETEKKEAESKRLAVLAEIQNLLLNIK